MQNEKRKTKNDSVKLKINPPEAGYQSFSLFTFHFSLKQGFTLLETIIALSLILAAMVGPVAVVTRSISSFPSAKNRLTALNLAQEGIELVRLVRENNILCDQLNGNADWRWDHDPDGSGGIGKNQTREVDIYKTSPIKCKDATLNTPTLGPVGDQVLHRDPGTGLVGYSGAEPTIFKRTVTVSVPPDNPDIDANIDKNDQMDVIATVTWKERGIDKKVELRERLYNWR